MPTRVHYAWPLLLGLLWPLPAGAVPTPAAVTASVVELHEARKARVVSALLSNGALVHFRQMESPVAHLVVTLGGAEMLEDASTRGVSDVLAQALGGEAAAPADVRLEVAAGSHALRLRAWGSPEGVRAGASVLAGLLSRPTLSDEAIFAARDRVLRELERQKASQRTRIREQMQALLASTSPPDPRLLPPTPEDIARVTPEMVRGWLERHVRAGASPVEAAIVGDLPLDRALAIARTAVGGLALRPAPGESCVRMAEMQAAPWPGRPAGPLVGRAVSASNGNGRTVVMVGYLVPDAREIARVRALRAAARLLEQSAHKRLAVAGFMLTDDRVAAGVTSSPQPGRSMLLLTADVPAERATEAAEVLRGAFAAAATEAPDAGELRRHVGHLTATFESFGRDTGYWASLLSRSAAMDLEIDALGDGQGAAFYLALTPEGVREAVASVVNDRGRVELVIAEKKATE